jgi:hypothetical protein
MINRIQIKNALFNWKKLSLPKVAKYTSLFIGAIILICALIFIFFPDPIINMLAKDRITKVFTEAFPAYSIQLGDMHYNVWKNRLGCDSITLKSNDSAFSYSVASFSISGIDRIKLILQRNFTTNILTRSVIHAHKIALNFHQTQYELRFGMLHISLPDSEMTVDSIIYYSLLDNEQFFAKSKFRQTRFRIDIPQIKIMGLDFLALLQGNIYSARSINIHHVFADILVNMDKPYDQNSPNPQMPNEALSSMKEIIKVDSLKMINGELKYSERFVLGTKPGEISFNKVNILVRGIANHKAQPDTTVINGEGLFMNSGTLKLFMAIPLTSTDFSLRYSGSVSGMDVTRLNAFIEASEYQRIKSGVLESANFNIDVNSGHASGTLRVAYKHLSVAIINKKTGSEKGISDWISSIYGKIFIIRGHNMPDKKGLMKIGVVKYTREPDEPFIQFLWLALRSGVGDVVGF